MVRIHIWTDIWDINVFGDFFFFLLGRSYISLSVFNLSDECYWV